MARDEDLPSPRLAVGAIDGPPLRRYAPDRTCSWEGCSTLLSVYNGGERCWAHTEAQPLLPLRRRQVRAA